MKNKQEITTENQWSSAQMLPDNPLHALFSRQSFTFLQGSHFDINPKVIHKDSGSPMEWGGGSGRGYSDLLGLDGSGLEFR